MIAATGGEGTVAILTSSLGSEKEQEEIAAFMDAIADTNLEVAGHRGNQRRPGHGCVTKMEAIVQTYPDLTAVLGTSAYDVQAAARVKYEYGLDGLKLVGYDDQGGDAALYPRGHYRRHYRAGSLHDGLSRREEPL